MRSVAELKLLFKSWDPLPKSEAFVRTESVLSNNFVSLLCITLRRVRLSFIKKDTVYFNNGFDRNFFVFNNFFMRSISNISILFDVGTTLSIYIVPSYSRAMC